MSDIHIRRPHGLTLKKARAAAERIAGELEEEYGLDWGWDGNTLSFERTGISGHLSVTRHEVEIVIRLGFLLLGLRRRIDREVHAYCDAQFGKSTKAIV